MRYSKEDAAAFIRQRAALFDLDSNPFGKSAWLLHFIDQVVQPEWTIIAPQSTDGESTMLLIDDGKQVRAMANYYSSLHTPAVGSSHNWPQLIRLLRQYPTVDLSPLDGEDYATDALQQAFESERWYVRRYFAHGNWYLRGVPFDAYLASRGSQLRNTITRKGRAFPGDLRIFTSPDEVDAGMDAYEAVYAKSWKQPEPYPRFARGLARICAENGWLRLGIASMCGVPIAAHFWFVVDGKAHIWKLAYDEEYAKTSAGTLLTAHLMRHVLDVDKVREVDYLTGDDPYKSQWMTHRRERIGMIACNLRTARGVARAGMEYLGEVRHRVLRRGRQGSGAAVEEEARNDEVQGQ